jgi:hypothetical protein
MVAARPIWGSYGSRVCRVDAVCTILEADGTIWEPHLPYDGHMGTMCTIWELRAPYGSCMHHIGATCAT